MPDDREFWRSPQGQVLQAEYRALWDAAETAKKAVAVVKAKPGALWVEVQAAEREHKRLQALYERRMARDFPEGS